MMKARRIDILMLFLCATWPAQAAPSTPNGEISVSQVVDLIQRSSTDKAARNATMAYLAGVGESTGVLIAKVGKQVHGAITCVKPLGISSGEALTALLRTEKKTWGQTAATPILVNDMLNRAGCE